MLKKKGKDRGYPLTPRTFGEPLLYLLPFLLIISIFMIYPLSLIHI